MPPSPAAYYKQQAGKIQGAEGRGLRLLLLDRKPANVHQDKLVPACLHTQEKGGSKAVSEGWRERADADGIYKVPWVSCAVAAYLHYYWPPLSLSLACVSVCLQASQSGSVTHCCFSSWLLLCSLHHPLLSHSVFTFPLLSHSSSHFLLFLLLLLLPPLPLVVLPVFNFPQFPCSCHLPPPSGLVLLQPTTSSLLPTPLLLTGRGGG